MRVSKNLQLLTSRPVATGLLRNIFIVILVPFFFLFGVHSANKMGNVSSWPKETIAQGSSVHPPNIFADRLMIHNDSLAIDGNEIFFGRSAFF